MKKTFKINATMINKRFYGPLLAIESAPFFAGRFFNTADTVWIYAPTRNWK